MAFIWSPQALESLFLHPSAEVRRWAIDKAFELYPDILCDRVVALVSPIASEASRGILRHLAELDLPISNSDPLVNLAQSNVESEVKALAGAILLRSGYALLPDDRELVSATTFADIVGLTERGFGLVLHGYRGCSGENKSILDDIAHVCNFADLPRDLARAQAEEGIKKRVDYFRQLWECNIPRLQQLSQPEEILSALDEALARVAPEDSIPWKRGLLAELEHDRARLGALREIAGERIPRWSLEERRFLLACILCLWRNEACQGRLVEAKDVAGLWGALVMKPWRGVPGQALRDFLLSVNSGELLNSLSKGLHHEYSYASYAFSVLNALDTPGRFELFLDVFEGKKYGDILAEEADEALRKAGTPAAEFIIERYPRMSESLRILILFVLDSFPTPQVVDFCLKHFDEYMRSSAPEEFVSCLEEIASSRFLSPLLREWREGEVGIGSAIKLISEINNIRDEQIDSIIQDTEKRTRHPEEALGKPISSFPLRCTNCGHTYEYELKNIYVGKGGSPVIGDIIQCKGCGSIETYEMTVHSRFGVTAELLRLAALRQTHKEEVSDRIDSPVKVYSRFDMTALGRKVKSMGEAYHLLKNEIEKHPQDADLQKRMGNLLKNGGKTELALPYYLEAIRLNPDDPEAHQSIVDMLIDQKRYSEAIPYLERLVPLCRECKMDEVLRRNMFSALLDQAYIIQNETGHKVELFLLAKPEDLARAKESITLDVRSFERTDPEEFEWLYHVFRYGRVPEKWPKPEATIEATRQREETLQLPIVKGEKVGRNDPCPCGSGKKYKKCCGR